MKTKVPPDTVAGGHEESKKVPRTRGFNSGNVYGAARNLVEAALGSAQVAAAARFRSADPKIRKCTRKTMVTRSIQGLFFSSEQLVI